MRHTERLIKAMMLDEERRCINQMIDAEADPKLKLRLIKEKQQLVWKINALVTNKPYGKWR